MARNKTYDIFLSHSSADKDFTDKLHNLLELSGFHVWYDEKRLTSSTQLLSGLPTYINDSEVFIVVFSQDSCKSSWVQENRLIKWVDRPDNPKEVQKFIGSHFRNSLSGTHRGAALQQ